MNMALLGILQLYFILIIATIRPSVDNERETLAK